MFLFMTDPTRNIFGVVVSNGRFNGQLFSLGTDSNKVSVKMQIIETIQERPGQGKELDVNPSY